MENIRINLYDFEENTQHVIDLNSVTMSFSDRIFIDLEKEKPVKKIEILFERKR